MNQGGFTPWEALRGGTIDGATHLGMNNDLGSIEVGKLADMAVIQGDVLSDIKRSEFVTYTVLNGRVYESATMNQIGSNKTRHPFFFEANNQLFMPADTMQEIEAKARKYHWQH